MIKRTYTTSWIQKYISHGLWPSIFADVSVNLIIPQKLATVLLQSVVFVETVFSVNLHKNVLLRSLQITWKSQKSWQPNSPTNIYLNKVNNRYTRNSCEIYSKLTIKTPYFTPSSSVSIVDFEQINVSREKSFFHDYFCFEGYSELKLVKHKKSTPLIYFCWH